ncbi:hypothetical protein FACS1894188_12860 [Clostridia bacterium]|nr:hypothetical protein FACS1894188_12860 [Clostridia bacterium]
MSDLGRLAADKGQTEFLHIPDWYEWQRNDVATQIESGEYYLDIEVRVESLPNAKGFVPFGKARLRHDRKGFLLNIFSSDKELFFNDSSMNSVHTEYDYRRRGDGIVLSTQDCCYYLYFDLSVANMTKIQFAQEYFYEHKEICR